MAARDAIKVRELPYWRKYMYIVHRWNYIGKTTYM